MAQDGGLAQRRWNASEVRQLYQRHSAALVAYACSFLPDLGAAEDAVHSVFVKLLRGSVARPESDVGYLYRAVKNVALNTKRDFAREVSMEADQHWFVHRAGDAESALALQRVLGELPEEQREVVMMRIWSGMTLEEIGTATGVPLNTAASRYRYAIEKLRERLGERRKEGKKERRKSRVVNEEQFENYLREFQPKKPRALPALEVAPVKRRRLVAAAAMVFVCGSCLWIGLKEKRDNKNSETVSAWKMRIVLTNRALENPQSLEKVLEEQTKGSLPRLDGQESTLGVLAKE